MLRAVYGAFQDWMSGDVESFPVLATDDIAEVYGIVDEDLDELGMDILDACGRALPPPEVLQGLTPVKTVADMVRFVAAAPQGELVDEHR